MRCFSLEMHNTVLLYESIQDLRRLKDSRYITFSMQYALHRVLNVIKLLCQKILLRTPDAVIRSLSNLGIQNVRYFNPHQLSLLNTIPLDSPQQLKKVGEFLACCFEYNPVYEVRQSDRSTFSNILNALTFEQKIKMLELCENGRVRSRILEYMYQQDLSGAECYRLLDFAHMCEYIFPNELYKKVSAEIDRMVSQGAQLKVNWFILKCAAGHDDESVKYFDCFSDASLIEIVEGFKAFVSYRASYELGGEMPGFYAFKVILKRLKEKRFDAECQKKLLTILGESFKGSDGRSMCLGGHMNAWWNTPVRAMMDKIGTVVAEIRGQLKTGA